MVAAEDCSDDHSGQGASLVLGAVGGVCRSAVDALLIHVSELTSIRQHLLYVFTLYCNVCAT